MFSANVVIADVLEQEGRRLADELGDHAIFSRFDVTSDRDWAATVARGNFGLGAYVANKWDLRGMTLKSGAPPTNGRASASKRA